MTSVSVSAAKVVVKLPLKSIVKVSPETAVVIFVPPAIVKVSDVESAVVVPLSPATDAQILREEIPAVSSPGSHLPAVLSHLRTCPSVGAAVVTSISFKRPILEYSVRTFA